jgi:hypothetical protein
MSLRATCPAKPKGRRGKRGNLIFFFSPDITEFALRKSRVEAYKNLSVVHLKDFSLNGRFLANYV